MSNNFCISLISLILLLLSILNNRNKQLKQCPRYYKLFSSGSSDNHFKLLLLLLHRLHILENHICIVLWDLGLSKKNKIILKNAINIIENSKFIVNIDTFDYNKYPVHFNININAGEYAWKPFVIYNTYKKYKMDMLWLDCGCYITGKLDFVYKQIKRFILYTVDSGTTIKRFTYFKMFELLRVDKIIYNKRMCSAGVFGIHYPSQMIDDIFRIWKACALIKECISPEGSNRSNHRQDQSVLSILLYQNYINYTFSKREGFITHFDRRFNSYNSSSFNSFLLEIDKS